MKSKNRLYYTSVAILAAILSVLHTLSLLTIYDTEVGYLNSTPLVILLRILYVLGAAWCLSIPFLLPKETPFISRYSNAHTLLSYFAAILFILSGISILAKSLSAASLSFPTTSALTPVLGIFTALASVFFFTARQDAKKSRMPHAICGFLVLGFLFSLLFYIYFDMYVTINSPLKNAIQLSVLSALLFTLCQIRAGIGKSTPRITVASRLLCVLFCLPTAISHLFFGASNLCDPLERTVVSPFLSLPLLALGIFALSETIFYKD